VRDDIYQGSVKLKCMCVNRLVYVQTNRAFVLWPSRATEPFLK
jgi:hypothetical protein